MGEEAKNLGHLLLKEQKERNKIDNSKSNGRRTL